MKKEDFKVGQTVWVYLVGSEARGKDTPRRIVECEVTKIARKYITVRGKDEYWVHVEFDMTDNFREKTEYSIDYMLFLSKEDIYKEIKANEIITLIHRNSTLINMLTLEEAETIWYILEKYKSK